MSTSKVAQKSGVSGYAVCIILLDTSLLKILGPCFPRFSFSGTASGLVAFRDEMRQDRMYAERKWTKLFRAGEKNQKSSFLFPKSLT